MARLHDVGTRARRHRGGDRYQLGMLAGERAQRVAEDLGPGGRAARLLTRFTRHRIVGREAVPFLPVALREVEALPLLRDHMDDARARHATDEAERLTELGKIVPV